MLYIIVPVHNRIETTLLFIESLYNQEFNDFQLIIINDGSTDNTENILNKKYPEVIVLNGEGNLFWGGAINLGLEYIERKANEDDYIAFANNDILLNNNSISSLLAEAKRSPGIYHSLAYNHNNTIISSGAKIISWPLFYTKHPLRGMSVKDINSNELFEIDLMTARFVVFPFNLLSYVNRIDTKRFKHYAGDNDFSYSMKKKGVKTYIYSGSFCYVNEKTTGDNPKVIKNLRIMFKSFFSIRSTNNLKVRFSFGLKHCPKLYLPFYFISVLLQLILLNIVKKG